MDEYKNYIELKGWNNLFEYSDADIWQFNTILGDVNVNGKKVLEIGFGSGALMEYLRDGGAEVFGVEIQSRLITEAERKGYAVSDNIKNFEGEKFDIIIALDVLEHLAEENLRELLHSVNENMTVNGMFIARFPNCQSPAGLYNQFGDHTHLQMLSAPILSSYLTDYRLKIFDIRKGRSNAEYEPRLVRRYLKFYVKLLCEKIVKIALGFSSNTLAANILVYIKRNP